MKNNNPLDNFKQQKENNPILNTKCTNSNQIADVELLEKEYEASRKAAKYAKSFFQQELLENENFMDKDRHAELTGNINKANQRFIDAHIALYKATH